MKKPGITLRVAVAGALRMDDGERSTVAARLSEVYSVLLGCLQDLARKSGQPANESSVVAFYEAGSEPGAVPVLRLVGGLADGFDQLAFDVLLDLESSVGPRPSSSPPPPDFELVAILPCDPMAFRNHSPVSDKGSFDRLLSRCDSVVQLDGICEPKDESSPARALNALRRARCFQAQSEMLLRQCDLLIAAPRPDAKGGVGGTAQTIAAAVQMAIPVVRISLGASGEPVVILKDRADWNGDLRDRAVDWRQSLRATLARILSDSESAGERDSSAASLTPEEREFLTEFFHGNVPKKDYRHWLWKRFESLFRPHAANSRGDTDFRDRSIEYFRPYRARASEMSAFYAGKYRGAFLANYAMAAGAVFLAVAALVWIIFAPHGHISELALLKLLIAMALLKLGALVAMYRNTHHGNEQRWNDKAIDYRYISERLRTFYYLPRVGSLFAAAPRSAHYARGVLRQKSVSWFFYAIVRRAPVGVGMEQIDPPVWTRPIPGRTPPRFYRVRLAAAAEEIRANWLGLQIDYHERVARTQSSMSDWIESGVSRSSILVISIVLFDVLLLALLISVKGAGGSSEALEFLHDWSPLLVFGAAVLPAVIASLNGLAFQSESERLATRSAGTAVILRDVQDRWGDFRRRFDRHAFTPSDPGAWILTALDLAESSAQVVTDEVAEWSVLYSRDLTEL